MTAPLFSAVWKLDLGAVSCCLLLGERLLEEDTESAEGCLRSCASGVFWDEIRLRLVGGVPGVLGAEVRFFLVGVAGVLALAFEEVRRRSFAAEGILKTLSLLPLLTPEDPFGWLELLLIKDLWISSGRASTLQPGGRKVGLWYFCTRILISSGVKWSLRGVGAGTGEGVLGICGLGGIFSGS